MGTDKTCTCETKHAGHICELELRDEMDKISRITNDSVVSCASCGAEANSSEYVCSPVEIYRESIPEQLRDIEFSKKDQIPDFLCHCTEEHENHLCQLRKDGKIQEVKKMSKDPAVSCLLCEEIADSADHVCSPVKL